MNQSQQSPENVINPVLPKDSIVVNPIPEIKTKTPERVRIEYEITTKINIDISKENKKAH